MNALVKFELIPMPDLRKPTGMPSLPVWLATQRAALAPNLQLVTLEGVEKFEDVTTLPTPLMPNTAQRQAIERHCLALKATLEETPENGDEWATETMTVVTKMQLVLSSMKASELAGEAKAEAYMDALEDLPSWAVVAVRRRWNRGQCGNDEHGKPYEYKWMPDPATMRRLVVSETFRVRNQISELDQVLLAKPYRDCTTELEAGRAAWDGLRIVMKSNDPADIEKLTFARAAEVGRAENEKQIQEHT